MLPAVVFSMMLRAKPFLGGAGSIQAFSACPQLTLWPRLGFALDPPPLPGPPPPGPPRRNGNRSFLCCGLDWVLPFRATAQEIPGPCVTTSISQSRRDLPRLSWRMEQLSMLASEEIPSFWSVDCLATIIIWIPPTVSPVEGSHAERQ